MSGQGEVYDTVEQILAKLYVLRGSCAGIVHADESSPKAIWFQGAEAILGEAVDGLQKVLQSMESGETSRPVVTEDVEEEVEIKSGKDQKKASTDEEE